jgi:hypothetical protein
VWGDAPMAAGGGALPAVTVVLGGHSQRVPVPTLDTWLGCSSDLLSQPFCFGVCAVCGSHPSSMSCPWLALTLLRLSLPCSCNMISR